MSLWSETTQAKAIQSAGAYAAASLALWGALDLAIDAFSLRGDFLRIAIVATIGGFPVAVLTTWFLGRRRTDAGGSQWKGVAVGGAVAAVICGALFAMLDAPQPSEVANGNSLFEGRAAIAVLPFENLSDDGSNQHFADGIADDILTSLQSWGVFPVIARSSTRAYRGKSIDIKAVAASLGVRYLLTGSVRAAGDKILVATQLIDGRSNVQLWADRFERDTADIFAIQDQITQEIVNAIAPEMTRSEMRKPVGRPAELATWELVMRAQALMIEGSYEATREAERLLRLSIEREPGYALAYARLGEVGHDISNGYAKDVGDDAAAEAMIWALDEARTAVRLNPLLVDGRVWLGHLLLHHRQIEQAIVELREAVRLSPSHPQAHAEYGFGLSITGDIDAALAEFAITYRLSPNDPRNDRIKVLEAFAYLYAGRNQEAIQTAQQIIDVQKNSALNVWPYLIQTSAFVRLGKVDEARTIADAFRSSFGKLDWPSIERGAWSQEELDRVHDDMIVAGMLPDANEPVIS